MCLTVPAKVLAVEGISALVESRGRQRKVDASLILPSVGDYVLLVSGVVVQRLDPEDAQEALRAWEEVEAATRA